jgi:transcriptional regulator with GAF, ATPase, and Fis domain
MSFNFCDSLGNEMTVEPYQSAQWIAEFALDLACADGLDDLVHKVISASLSHITGAQYAGVSLVQRHSYAHVASDERVEEIDRRQRALHEGPALVTAFEHQPAVHVRDLCADARWPRLRRCIADLDIRSAMSFRMATSNEALGAVTVYAAQPSVFEVDAVRAGLLLAAHAAAAASSIAKAENLQVALQSRDAIGQAKGILMERYKITADDAFAMLVEASQQGQRKLKDVAEHLAVTGEMPPSRVARAHAPKRRRQPERYTLSA